MRLLRVGESATQVAADVRAGLTALGRGEGSLGGVALVDVRPAKSERTFEAVLVTPHGIVIVAGIDLPGPALHLEAPLRGQWKADNWPLVGDGDAVNPAAAALGAAEELARRVITLTNAAIPVGLVLAVGPFVERVTGAPTQLENVRIVYPKPGELRAAILELAPRQGPTCSVEQARAVLRLLDPSAPIQSDDVLTREGFTAVTAAYAHAGPSTLAEQVATTPMQPRAQLAKAAALAAAPPSGMGSPAGRPSEADLIDHPTELMPLPLSVPQQQSGSQWQRGRPVRLLPIAAVLVIVASLIAAIVMATASGGEDKSASAKPAAAKPQPQQRYAISGVEFSAVDQLKSDKCKEMTYGDVQAAVQKAPCTGVRLASYLASVADRQAAVSLAVVDFAEPGHADQVKKVADRAGSGGAADAANASEKWPEGKLSFHHAIYRSTVEGDSVRLVRVAWIDQDSNDEELLNRVATTSFEVPVD